MRTLLILASLISMPAFAHFEIGTYIGTDSITGAACQLKITGVTFTNNMHHPLNEKVAIEVPFHSETREFAHLALVDSKKGTVRPKPETLSSVVAEATGASSYELIMDAAGPVQMIHVIDNYKDRAQSKVHSCDELIYQGQ